MKLPDQNMIAEAKFLFCTVNGSIGVVATLNEETFSVLDNLQRIMGTVVKGNGALDHAE